MPKVRMNFLEDDDAPRQHRLQPHKPSEEYERTVKRVRQVHLPSRREHIDGTGLARAVLRDLKRMSFLHSNENSLYTPSVAHR